MVARKKVKWIEGAKTDKNKPPYPLISERPLEEYVNHTVLQEGLVPGKLWFAHCNLSEQTRFTRMGYKPHEFPYLDHDPFGNFIISKGTAAVYAGTVRVEEISKKGVLTRVLRHSFIIGGRRYITADIGKYFYPA